MSLASSLRRYWVKHCQLYGVAGDQQAALIGQACFNRGMAKSTMVQVAVAYIEHG